MTAVTVSALLNLVVMFLSVALCYEVRQAMNRVNHKLETQKELIKMILRRLHMAHKIEDEDDPDGQH